jgi:hypothetical protein
MRKLLWFFSLLICISTASAQQTYTITGIVTDDKDAPIPGATIFIGDSRKATATDGEGRFTLRQIKPGKYNLVVKMIGFVVTTHNFVLQNKDLKFRIKLPEDNEVLNTVNISTLTRQEREDYLEMFTRCFFGTSYAARECRILNPDIIKYSYNRDKNILTAATDDFLIIENKALGYKMKYLLTNFTYDIGSVGGLIAFAGKLFYEDLPGDSTKMQKWEQARADVYLGSITHFFRVLFNDKLNDNSFVIYRVPNQQLLNAYAKRRKEIPQLYYKPVKSLNEFISGVDDNFKAFNLKPIVSDSTELYVLYTPKREPKDFTGRGVQIGRAFKMPLGQLSLLRPTGDTVLINKNGDVSPAVNLIKSGFWTWGQMSAFIPPDYEIPPELENAKLKRLRRRDKAVFDKQAE